MLKMSVLECQTSSSREVCASVWLDLTWLDFPCVDPREGVEDMRRRATAGRAAWERWNKQMEAEGRKVLPLINEIHERFGAPRRRREMEAAGQLPSPGGWNWYDARFMIAECLGAPPPEWDPKTRSWWQEREHCLSGIETADDVRRIRIPDWPRTEPVQKMMASHARWMEAFPEDGGGWGITWYMTLPGGGAANSIGYPSFVDLGIFLLGMTRFLEVLGGEPALAEALMDKCFELSTSYVEFLLSLKEERFEALCGFGGDVTCMLSPSLVERYGLPWDVRLFEFVRKTHGVAEDLPCNYHSCGPSAHLYEVWGRHPRRKNIKTLQTRLLPGTVRSLRENLPETYLEMTIHPQHFDLVEQPETRVKKVLWETAEAAGFHDLHMTLIVTAHSPERLDRVEKALAVCRDTLEEINAAIAMAV